MGFQYERVATNRPTGKHEHNVVDCGGIVPIAGYVTKRITAFDRSLGVVWSGFVVFLLTFSHISTADGQTDGKQTQGSVREGSISIARSVLKRNKHT